MPFLGRDWRSPGDEWVRTKEGWEKLKLWRVKVFENLNSKFLARLLRLALNEWDKDHQDLHNVHQPYIHYMRTTSRERKVLTTISEAFIHLDMSGAGRDLRRFNYVCKLILLILQNKLHYMSGAAQKHVFIIMEEMVTEVLKSQNNVRAMKQLVAIASCQLYENRYCHIGSSCLWNHHVQSVNKMTTKLNKFKVKERSDDNATKFSDLPEECVRTIFTKLADHRDIIRLGQADTRSHEVMNEVLLWKQMSFFHFTNRQLVTFLPQDKEEFEIDWKYIYRKCCLRYGTKDLYADMLAICCHCDNIFWQSIGHPCISELKPQCRTLTPQAFINLFQY